MARDKITRRSFLQTSGAAVLAGLADVPLAAGAGQVQDGGQIAPVAAPTPDEGVAALLEVPEAVFRPTASGCTLHWVARGEVEARVLAGAEADRLAPVREVTSSGPSEVVLRGFEPGRDVYVQCEFRRPGDREWRARPARRLHTARAPGASFRVALIADSHIGPARTAPLRKLKGQRALQLLGQTMTRVLRDRPDFAIFLGDEACTWVPTDPPGFMSQARAVARWRQWRGAVAPLVAGVPSFLVLGNHEGEGGYFQALRRHSSVYHYQRWSTIARKRYCLNPLPDTYPEGGENEGWRGDPESEATGGADQGNCSPLQNYYAWSWGDALFAVLDVDRYTKIGGSKPAVPQDWTLGPSQMRWLERVLTASPARWKFVVAHHLVGGSQWNSEGTARSSSDGASSYGRGGARYARVGEQARITDVMKRAGARFFLYGHDHVFAHQQAEGIHFVCCGKPTLLNPRWWPTPGWKEAYGDVAARKPHDFYATVGYTRLSVAADRVSLEYVRTGTHGQGVDNVDKPEGEVVYAFSAT